tara:strand:+ start:11893 stop:13206 length:1314 start_codon:yes stop_codon:yes gene_type:complete
MVMSLTIVIMPHAFAQEFTKSTFSENIVVVYDLSLFKDVGSFLMKKSAGDIEVVIGLQSTSNNDFKFSDELIKKIQSEDLIQSIVFTNMNDIDHKGDLVGCVPGVKGNEQCILVNLDFSEIKKFITDEDLEQADGRINRVQIETKKISDTLIEEINESLGTNAKFHSVFIQSQMTEYDVSDEGEEQTVSAVYTSPKQSSYELINQFSKSILAEKITMGGGFYDIAKEFSKDETRDLTLYSGEIVGQTITPATVSLTIFPKDDGMRYLLNVSVLYRNIASSIAEIDPLEYLNVTELQRSKYFGDEFVPLDSLLDLIVQTPEKEPIMIGSANTNIIKKISTVSDIMEKGWFFDSAHGSFIAGKYLFGNSNVVTNDELKLEIVQWDGNTETDIQVSTLEEVMEERVEMDTDTEQSQYVILAVIIIVAIAAAIYYMKGYKR